MNLQYIYDRQHRKNVVADAGCIRTYSQATRVAELAGTTIHKNDPLIIRSPWHGGSSTLLLLYVAVSIVLLLLLLLLLLLTCYYFYYYY